MSRTGSMAALIAGASMVLLAGSTAGIADQLDDSVVKQAARHGVSVTAVRGLNRASVAEAQLILSDNSDRSGARAQLIKLVAPKK